MNSEELLQRCRNRVWLISENKLVQTQATDFAIWSGGTIINSKLDYVIPLLVFTSSVPSACKIDIPNTNHRTKLISR